MDYKTNTFSGSREHINELSEIIRTAVLREIPPHIPTRHIAVISDSQQEAEVMSSEVRHKNCIKKNLSPLDAS